jgi:glycosyltransferase involved in cell wall biosynthesis
LSVTSDKIYYVNSDNSPFTKRNYKYQERSPVLLSVVVITKNEADRIGALLKSVSFTDEIIVVDSGSTDATIEICRNSGVRVEHQEWLGYVGQKQYAMELASGEWILNLDADEIVSDQLAQEIRSAIENCDDQVTGYSMPRLSRYLDRWIKHGGWYPDRKLRLVRKGTAQWTGNDLHELLQTSGKVGTLNNPLLHYVYRDIFDQVSTINRFSDIIADSRVKPASNLYVILGIFHAIGKFLECAVWKLGFLDGIPGLIIALNSSFYIFLKHAKSWEKSLSYKIALTKNSK